MLRTIILTVARLCRRQARRDRFEWRELFIAPFFARDREGRRIERGATVYRRRKADDSGWEYRQEPESDDDWATRVGW